MHYVLINKTNRTWKPKGFHFEESIDSFKKNRDLRLLFQRNHSASARSKAVAVANAAVRSPDDSDTKPKVADLIEKLKAKAPAARRNTAFKLGKIGSAAIRAAPALITALKDSDASVRQFAAYALGRIGPAAKDALPALAVMVRNEKGDVRHAAQDAIEKIKPGF